MVNGQSVLSGRLDHQVGTLRRPAHSKNGVAALEQPLGDRMEDLLEWRVADLTGSGESNEWEREPFAHERNLSGDQL